jgi:hypothetical protein
VKAPEARLRGGGFLSLVADRKERALDAKVRADFGGLEAIYGDLIRKAAGVPLAFDLVAAQTARGQEVRFDLRAADLKATGQAALHPAGADQAVDGEITVAPFRVRSLTAMLPSLTKTPIGDIRAGAKLHLRGRLGDPGSMEVKIEDLALAAGKSDLHGRLSLAGLEKPRVEAQLKSSYLDIDDFVPPPPPGSRPVAPEPASATASKGKKGTKGKAEKDPLADVTGRVLLEVARGRATGVDYQGLKADLRLAGGRAVASVLEVGVFGGHFSGSGTELSLLDEEEPFQAKGTLSGIDIGAVATHYAGVPDLLAGRLDGKIVLGGAGTTPSLLQQTLDGILEGGLREVQFLGGAYLDALLAPLAAKVNALPGAARLLDTSNAAFRAFADRTVADVNANLKVAKGAINLAQPMTLHTRSGPLRLDGRVLLGGKWDMAGVLTLSAEAASALTGNRLKIDRPIPVKLTITGPLAHPRVAPAALDEVARIYALAVARSGVGLAVKEKLKGGAENALERAGLRDKLPATSADDAKAKAEAEAAAARAKAEAQAQAELEEARRRSDEAKAKAEAEARARADEAKQKASEKAKDRLRGVLGR